MNYENLSPSEKSALKKYVELEQLELLGCGDKENKKYMSYIRCSIGPEKTKVQLPSKIMIDIQNKAIENCRNKKRNKAH